MADIYSRTPKNDIIKLATAGFRWKLYETVFIIIMQLPFGIILARLLLPEAFGLFLYAMIFIGIISIYAEAGIPQAIIQRQNLTKEHITVGFTLSLLISGSATISLWMLAPIFTEGTETAVLRIVSLSFLFSGCGAVSGALLEKELNFKQLFWAEVVSYGIGQGVLSIVLAMLGFGVWSLAYGVLLYRFIKSVILILIIPNPIGFSLKRDAVKELMHFGFGKSLTRLANYSAQNGDYFVIGRLLPPEALGFYSRAFQIARIPTSYLASLLSSILFPVYAAVQDDNQKLRKGFYSSVALVSFITFPLMVWLFIAAGKLIPTVYGPAWTGSIRSLRILAVSGALGSIYTLCDTLAMAKGLVYAQFKRHSIYAVMVVIGAVVGIGYGIEGVAFAVSFAVLIMYVLMVKLSISIVDGTWREFFRAQVPGVVAGMSVALVSNAVLFFGDKYLFADLIVLSALILSFAATYFIMFVLFPMSFLGEIPEFLFLRSPSLLHRRFLKILTHRLNSKRGVNVHDDPVEIAYCVKLFTKFKNTNWFELVRSNVFVRYIRRAMYEVRTLIHIFQNSLVICFLRRLRGVSSIPVTQSPLSWNVKIGRIRNFEDLKDFLAQNHIAFNEGGNAIYIPPQSGLEQLMGKMVAFYPPDAGFKILKHFQPPEKASYVGHCGYGSQGDCYSRRILTGSIKDQVDSANILHMFEIGPALYDVAKIIANETVMTCFVVQHVDGVSPTEEEHIEFLKRLSKLINDSIFALVPPEGLKFIDFKSPNCNRNLIKSDDTGALMYVDFQQFILRNKEKLIKQTTSDSKRALHFGGSRFARGDKYLYQSIPGTSCIGKRDIDKRWSLIKNLLYDFGIEVTGRIVLDIGCNAGMMLSCALADGATWGIGWDLPDVVKWANRLNAVLGNTRLNLYAAELSEEYPISNDIPGRFKPLLGESVVFYLAVWRHMGFISELGKIPWKALVFEGHEGDTWGNLNDKLLEIQSEWGCTLTVKSDIRDGDCGTRPIALLLRENSAQVPRNEQSVLHSS